MKHKRSGGQPSVGSCRGEAEWRGAEWLQGDDRCVWYGAQGSTPGVHWADYRKPQGYWAPYNQWWREFVDTTAERPSKAHIEKWYLEHAEVVWPDRDNRPTMAETLAHNKNCRTKASSRDYARQRRERLRLQPGCIANACEDSTTAQSWGQEEGGAQSTNEGSSADELWRCQCGKRQTSFCPALTSPPADFPVDPFAWPGWTSQSTAFVHPKLARLPCGLYLAPVKAIGETLPANHSGPTGSLWGLTRDDTDMMEAAILPFPLDHPLPSPPPWLTSPQLSGMPHPDTSLAAPCAVSPASPPGVVLQLRTYSMPAMQTDQVCDVEEKELRRDACDVDVQGCVSWRVDSILSEARAQEIRQNASSSQRLSKTLTELFEQYAIDVPVGPAKWTTLANFLASKLSHAFVEANQKLEGVQAQLSEAQDRMQQQANQVTQAESQVAELEEKVEKLRVQLEEREARQIQALFTGIHTDTEEPNTPPLRDLPSGPGISPSNPPPAPAAAAPPSAPDQTLPPTLVAPAQPLAPLPEAPDQPLAPLPEAPDQPLAPLPGTPDQPLGPLPGAPTANLQPPYDVDTKLVKMTQLALDCTLVDLGIAKQGASNKQMWVSIAQHFLPENDTVLAASTIAGLQHRLRIANYITVEDNSRDRWEELVRKAWDKDNDGVNYAVRRQSWVHTKHTKDEIRNILLTLGYVHEVVALGSNPSRDMWRNLADDLLGPQMAA
ncbi:hypothetical protein QJQ45_018068 [Haematococcus lacustris]|nr:hypothetical protein QJQ45_018068 [Haematococcus lacustris]